MHGESRITALLRQALRASTAGQTEVMITAEDSFLTRFANSAVHQNVAERNATLSVRAVDGTKIGAASTNILSDEAVRRTVKQACAIAKVQRDNPDFVSLPRPVKATLKAPRLFYAGTANCSARQRAAGAKIVCDLADRHGAQAYGAFSTGTAEIGIANSLGVTQYACCTDAYVNTIAMTATGAGYAQGAARDVGALDLRAIAAHAVRKAVDSQRPAALRPGRYEVVLEPTAVATFLEFLAGGFSALAVQEGHSFMGLNMGKRIVHPSVTIGDDAYSASGLAFPFDFEGLPRQRVTLIDRGVARAVVHNSYTANKEKTQSTGHGTGSFFPYPMNLTMRGGDSSLKKMVASVGRGVYVTRFNYCNIIDPMKVEITGMTRDGTFLIEDGKITKPVRNLRFTESVLKALSNVTAISRDVTLVSEGNSYGSRFAAGVVVPALQVEDFNFTGTTEF
ncbi:MAG TPA: TldD/PmbA family protein [Candidatus Edwardsbacteria bacterium]|nr:TldD/PmbA family protein [Candidatus Edwardsbacteria bacterium]